MSTPNFQLVKPTPEDLVDINVINGNMDKIDQASPLPQIKSVAFAPGQLNGTQNALFFPLFKFTKPASWQAYGVRISGRASLTTSGTPRAKYNMFAFVHGSTQNDRHDLDGFEETDVSDTTFTNDTATPPKARKQTLTLRGSRDFGPYTDSDTTDYGLSLEVIGLAVAAHYGGVYTAVFYPCSPQAI